MLRIAPTEEFLRRTTRLASKAADRALTIRCRESGLRARALARLAKEMPDAIVVRSRNALDQAERAIFDVATALGEDVVQEIDGRLREEPDEPTATLELLSARLDGRHVLVDGFDELLSGGLDRELGYTQERRRRSVYQWLSRKGRVFLVSGGGAPAHAIVGLDRTPQKGADHGLTSLLDQAARWAATPPHEGFALYPHFERASTRGGSPRVKGGPSISCCHGTARR